MMYALGLITGLLLAIIVLLSARRFETPITRTLKQAENLVKEKGEIFEPDDDLEELKHYINNLPKE